jgi:hypothetical protein
MAQDRQVGRILTAVVRSLRQEFPDDFFKRCHYAAFGMRALLADAGVASQIVGGDLAAFIVSTDGRRSALQGFGYGQDQCAHYWVASDQHLFDVGPHLMPYDAAWPIAAQPLIAWDLAAPLPAYLRYRTLQRFAAAAPMGQVEAHNLRCDRFVAACRDRSARQAPSAANATWLLVDAASTAAAARRRDVWAGGALAFADRRPPARLPF